MALTAANKPFGVTDDPLSHIHRRIQLQEEQDRATQGIGSSTTQGTRSWETQPSDTRSWETQPSSGLTALRAPGPKDDPATHTFKGILEQEKENITGGWQGPSDTRTTTSSGSGFFSPDGAINFARDYAEANAPANLRDEVSETASTFATPLRRDEPPSSETSNTIDRAVTEDPTRGFSRTVETGKIVREERPVYNPNRATQGISSRPTQDTDTRPTVSSGQATQGIGGSATPTEARATQGIGSRVSNFFNTIRDTVTPSAYEYGGNIAKSAFQGGEQVNRTDFKDSDVVSLFERTDADQVPRTTGAKTRFSDTKVYENEEGVLVPHTEETLKQFPPNARGLVHDYTSPPSLGVLENIPGVTAVKEAGSAIRYGYDNPLGVRGEGYVEINQPNKFEAPTAVYKDAAYLNLKSDDPNETAGGQGLIGRAISNLTGNKSDILGTEFASTELPYSQWSQKMRADYGFPNFQDSLEATANNETSFSNNYLDQYVDKLGNVKKGVTKDRYGQATGFALDEQNPFGTAGWMEADIGDIVRSSDGTSAIKTETGWGDVPATYWEDGRQFEVQPEVYNQQGELVAPEGRTEITDPWSMENLEKKGFVGDGTLVAGGRTLYGDTDYGLQDDGTLGTGDDDWGSDIDVNELENLGLGIELAKADTGKAEKGFLDNYIKEPEEVGLLSQNELKEKYGDPYDQHYSGYFTDIKYDTDEDGRLYYMKPDLEWTQEGGVNYKDWYKVYKDEEEPSGNYIKNEDTGEVTKVGGSKPGGINTGATTDLNPQSSQPSQPTAREHNRNQGPHWTSGYYRNKSVDDIIRDGYSQSEANQIKAHIAEGDRIKAQAKAMDEQIDAAYKEYRRKSDYALNYLGGRTDGTQEEYAEAMRRYAASDAASARYAALEQQQMDIRSRGSKHTDTLSQYL